MNIKEENRLHEQRQDDKKHSERLVWFFIWCAMSGFFCALIYALFVFFTNMR